MFGFPHPNGFAIEPQFMGNLLLFPTLLAIYLLAKNNKKISLWILSFFFSSTLFLTFSRGAIYSFAVALIFLIAFLIARKKSIQPLSLLLIPIFAFLFTLNFQGVFAEASKTSETYISGISKALNHLSLGIIDLKIPAPSEPSIDDKSDNYEPSQESKEQAVFDGYVEESTTVRMDLTKSALEVWSSNPKNLLLGVGIGGAGTALYENQKVGTPKEIVQNQYISLLLEIGLIGITGVSLSLFFIFRYFKNTIGIFTYTAIIAYGISLLFFAGLPNALHIYLLPAFFGKHKSIIKQKI